MLDAALAAFAAILEVKSFGEKRDSAPRETETKLLVLKHILSCMQAAHTLRSAPRQPSEHYTVEHPLPPAGVSSDVFKRKVMSLDLGCPQEPLHPCPPCTIVAQAVHPLTISHKDSLQVHITCPTVTDSACGQIRNLEKSKKHPRLPFPLPSSIRSPTNIFATEATTMVDIWFNDPEPCPASRARTSVGAARSRMICRSPTHHTRCAYHGYAHAIRKTWVRGNRE